jgi:pSer/pThr/pTyr-binding forkhead associated (FHA) protein
MIAQESEIGETNHQVAVATFTTRADLDLGLTGDYGAARQVVNGLQPQAQTNVGAGLQVANAALESAPAGAQKIIILLSDGLTNRGMTPPQILSGPVQESATAGTCIYTVGFGEPGDLDERLLRSIADGAACGEYHYASAPADLEQVYIRLRHQSVGTVLAEFEGQVGQGETVQAGEVEVPRNQGQMHVTLHWPGSELDLIVTDPRGRQVSDTDPGVNLVRYGNMIYLIVENPRPGPWLLKVFGADVPEGVLDYDAIVSVREKTGSSAANVGTVLLGVGLAMFVVFGVVLVATQTRRSKAPSAGVRVVEGQASRSFTPIRRRLTVGRHPRCDVVLSDPQVSARHAAIERTRQGHVLTDLNSKNGTYVDGQRVHQTILQGGERLRLGQTELLFNAQRPGVANSTPSRRRAARSAHVAVLAGDQEFARYPVSAGLVLGRHQGCSVDLRSDALVSRRHARLDYRNGQWIITDLSSDNQTFVNGHPVTAQALQNGDEIQLGNTRMRFYAS